MKCKYCEKPAYKGHMCRNCQDKHPKVKELMLIIKQIREVKRKRDQRRPPKK